MPYHIDKTPMCCHSVIFSKEEIGIVVKLIEDARDILSVDRSMRVHGSDAIDKSVALSYLNTVMNFFNNKE